MMTVTQRRATTIYSRSDFTIIDVIDLSDPSPVDYTPEEFFAFYEIIFNVDVNQTNWEFSTQFSFLESVASLLTDVDETIQSGGGNIQLRLQGFLACPLAVFNSAVLGPVNSELIGQMGKSLAFTSPSYRVFPNRDEIDFSY